MVGVDGYPAGKEYDIENKETKTAGQAIYVVGQPLGKGTIFLQFCFEGNQAGHYLILTLYLFCSEEVDFEGGIVGPLRENQNFGRVFDVSGFCCTGIFGGRSESNFHSFRGSRG